MTKKCNKCGIEKSLDCFHLSKGKSLGVKTACKDCINLRDRLKYHANPEKHNARTKKYKQVNAEKMKIVNRLGHYRRKYGISKAQLDAMAQIQNNCCAICNRQESELNHLLRVDHNHKTGKVRGLLCNGCNTTLGHIKDNTDTLKAAINYLERNA